MQFEDALKMKYPKWSEVSVNPTSISKKDFAKLLSKDPANIAVFCALHINADFVKNQTVQNTMKLFNKTSPQRIYGMRGYKMDLFRAESQFPLEFVLNNKRVLDFAHLYTQECADVELLRKYYLEMDMVSAILYLSAHNPRKLDFIRSHPASSLWNEILSDVRKRTISTVLLEQFGFNSTDEKNDLVRNTIITKELLDTVHSEVPHVYFDEKYIGASFDTVIYMMNTNVIPVRYGSMEIIERYIKSALSV